MSSEIVTVLHEQRVVTGNDEDGKSMIYAYADLGREVKVLTILSLMVMHSIIGS